MERRFQATIAVLRSAIDEITLYRYEQLPVDGQRKTLEEARRTAGLKNTGDLLAEIAKLREENELLRTQLEYWREREDADPLPFDDTEVDA